MKSKSAFEMVINIYQVAKEEGLCDYKVPRSVIIRFAARVASLIRNQENELCAQLLENHPNYDFCRCVCECAEMVRGRVNK